jgi:NADP-dependent 3-hydroxy acid dehydrogenase YdfG
MTATSHGHEPVVVITGGMSGIGRATATAFQNHRAHVVLWDLADQSEPDASPQSTQPDLVVDRVDVRQAAEVISAAERVIQRYARVDALVISAGITDHGRVESGDPDRWRAVIETNLLGTLHAARALLPIMKEQGQGHIIVVASVSGRETYVGEPAYIASKWGQVGFTHALRQEALEYGVRVTLVEPGLVDSPLTRNNPHVRPLLDAAAPLTPEDVAAAILFAFSQPPEVVVSELTIRPLRQGTPTFDL